jgi:hypothetical protein
MVADKGGFVGIYFMPFLAIGRQPMAADLVAHIEHAITCLWRRPRRHRYRRHRSAYRRHAGYMKRWKKEVRSAVPPASALPENGRHRALSCLTCTGPGQIPEAGRPAGKTRPHQPAASTKSSARISCASPAASGVKMIVKLSAIHVRNNAGRGRTLPIWRRPRLALAVIASTRSPARRWGSAIYRGATLIDGTGAAPRAGMSIIVEATIASKAIVLQAN